MSAVAGTAALAQFAARPAGTRPVLLDRASCKLQAAGLAQPVVFTYWHAGEETTYSARWDWALADGAPRVLVFEHYTGYFVCQSLPGQPFDIDPTNFGCDVAEDLLARDAWEVTDGARQGRRA